MTQHHDPISAERPSGFQQLTGYRLTRWSDGYAEMEIDTGPQHTNRNGLIHGGVIMTMLDVVAGHAVTYCAVPGRHRRTTTVALNTTFLAPASAGGTLTGKASLRGGGRKTVGVSAELYDQDGTLVAIAQGSYRYLGGSEDPEGIPRPADDPGSDGDFSAD